MGAMKGTAGFGIGVAIVAAIVSGLYFVPAPPVTDFPIRTQDTETRTASILFVGDMFFDRYIRRITDTVGGDFVFSCVRHLFLENDFAVGNLEGPITEHGSRSANTKPGDEGHYTFTFPPDTAATLSRNGVSAVSLGNNHIGNFGLSGIESTRNYLGNAGVMHFGGLSGDEPILRTEINGIPFSFIAYNQFGGDDATTVAEKIQTETANGSVGIVYAHWGEEYTGPTDTVRETARLFAKAGASAVIGSHPHVVQESEYIGDTLVYYSLGNFIFDQYHRAETSRGLAVLLHFSEENPRPSVTEYPVIMTNDGRTCEAIPAQATSSS